MAPLSVFNYHFKLIFIDLLTEHIYYLSNLEAIKPENAHIHTTVMQNSPKNRLFGNRKNSKNVRIKKYFCLVKPMKTPRKVKEDDRSS